MHEEGFLDRVEREQWPAFGARYRTRNRALAGSRHTVDQHRAFHAAASAARPWRASAASPAPITPVRPNRKLNLLQASILAVIVSLGTAFMLGYNDSLIRASNDFDRQLTLPLITAIPEGHWPPELLLEENFGADGAER